VYVKVGANVPPRHETVLVLIGLSNNAIMRFDGQREVEEHSFIPADDDE